MPGPRLPAIELTAEERGELERLARRPTTGQQLAERARIVLLAADRLNNCEIGHCPGYFAGPRRCAGLPLVQPLDAGGRVR